MTMKGEIGEMASAFQRATTGPYRGHEKPVEQWEVRQADRRVRAVAEIAGRYGANSYKSRIFDVPEDAREAVGRELVAAGLIEPEDISWLVEQGDIDCEG